MFANPYSLSKLAALLQGVLIQHHEETELFSEILVDSRRLASPVGVVFFALVTAKNNGHKYIPELYEKGVRSFVVSEQQEDYSGYDNCTFLKVKDTLKALQLLASYHRSKFHLPVIGITGSNGKTIIKEWMFQLLSGNRKVVRSPRSFNSQLGVPLSVLQLNSTHETALFEAGISEPDEMQNLETIIQPEIGIFTNIGVAHDENFINTAQKTGEKLKLFTRVKTLVFCFDHSEILEQLYKTDLPKKIRLFSWSRKTSTDLQVTRVEKTTKETIIQAIYKEKASIIRIPFTDEASFENAMHCWACMLVLGFSQDAISAGMSALSPVAMRLELKAGINNCTIINDSYNNDVHSLSIALDFLKQQKQHKKHTLILSDILQSGRSEPDLYAEVSQMVREKGIIHLIGIGPVLSRMKHLFSIEQLHFFDTTRDFLQQCRIGDFHDEAILLKGARIFEFENINRVLQQKAHQTVFEINLNALVSNLNYFKSLLSPETMIMVMVKAFSYGTGSYEIANLLQFHRVDYLAVAYADEGVELRQSGITLPIMVMSPEEQSLDAILTNRLEPEIYSFRILEQFIQHLETSLNIMGESLNIHIKLDTGMHRLGFSAEDIPELIRRLNGNKLLVVKSVFTHLAASGETVHDNFTQSQITRYRIMYDELRDGLGYKPLQHVLNSAGILRQPEARFDMVRLGIGLYGYSTDTRQQEKLIQIGRLKTIITQIKTIDSDESVGYNRRFFAGQPTQIAILPIGYADGLNRSYGNGKGKVIINGKAAQIIGDVCMDMIMADITGIEAKEGDEAILFGPEYPINHIAEDLNTIPYEILTGISRRVKRVYYHE